MKNNVLRWLTFLLGLFLIGLGVAFAKHSGLGISPVSAIPNIVSIKFDFFTIGTWLFIWNCLLVVGEFIILKGKFRLIDYLQIPLSLLLGVFTDAGMIIARLIPSESYILQLVLVVLGTVTVAAGISLTLFADKVMNAGEAFVKAISDTKGIGFSKVKVVFDVVSVTVSVILSLVFFNFKIVATREGTVIMALFTGVFVKLFMKILKRGTK